MRAHELPPPGPDGLAIAPDILDGLDDFWKTFGQSCTQVTFRPPDGLPGWKDRYIQPDFPDPDQIPADRIIHTDPQPLPYYVLKRGPGVDFHQALQTLADSAETGGYTLVVDIDPSNALSPVCHAGVSPRTIVIGLGDAGPHAAYPNVRRPEKLKWYRNYPATASMLASCRFPDSVAFAIPVDPEERKTIRIIGERAYRALIISPIPTADNGRVVVSRLLDANRLVMPGGEIFLVGEGNFLNASTMESWFDLRQGFSGIGRQLQELFQSYRVSYHNLDGDMLLRHFGIAGQWIAPDHGIVRDFMYPHSFHPGVLMLTGKK